MSREDKLVEAVRALQISVEGLKGLRMKEARKKLPEVWTALEALEKLVSPDAKIVQLQKGEP